MTIIRNGSYPLYIASKSSAQRTEGSFSNKQRCITHRLAVIGCSLLRFHTVQFAPSCGRLTSLQVYYDDNTGSSVFQISKHTLDFDNCLQLGHQCVRRRIKFDNKVGHDELKRK